MVLKSPGELSIVALKEAAAAWNRSPRNRRFLHEAPWAATGWKDKKIEALAKEDGVFVVKGPMCRWQMMATDKRGLQGTGSIQSAMAQAHPLDRMNRKTSSGIPTAAGGSSAEESAFCPGRESERSKAPRDGLLEGQAWRLCDKA